LKGYMMRINPFMARLMSVLYCLTMWGCAQSISDEDWATATQAKTEVYFNYPGSRAVNGWDTEADDVLVQLIDRANASIDFSVMGFSRKTVIAALERAFYRGVSLRFVGNARHAFGTVGGYITLDRLNIPTQVGNQNHIMHNKFFLIDRRFVITGTGNITTTGFGKNDNHWVLIDSPDVAADFQAEFDQMFSGRFGYAKHEFENNNTYQVGDSDVEVYFSPQEDAMGRILEGVANAKETIEFFIFAFTKDQLGSLLIQKDREFKGFNVCCDPAGGFSDPNVTPAHCDVLRETMECRDRLEGRVAFQSRFVRGVIDRSQLHSNGPYHESYRLIANGVSIRMDGNDNSYQPGDYQAGGGRQHSKTLAIDARTANPVILTGSFNWSSSATIANDETLVVLSNSPRIGGQYADYFEYLWRVAKPIGERYIGEPVSRSIPNPLKPGDVVFNEIQWDGFDGNVDVSRVADPATARDYQFVGNDEFIELFNTTNRTIDLSMWTIASETDFMVGIYPGTVIGPYERFLLIDHNTEPYDDLKPQFLSGAYIEPDFVMNMANDARFLRINLHNGTIGIRLTDPRGNVVDRAGDGLGAFEGGRRCRSGGTDCGIRDQINYSMERIHFDCASQGDDCKSVRDGTKPDAWRTCANASDEQRRQIRSENLRYIMATPGQANSGAQVFPAEDPAWRKSD
jgi:phosphatidylserine/phosphatidylglycerophosphate/cardiolipin synthase-like enzyme